MGLRATFMLHFNILIIKKEKTYYIVEKNISFPYPRPNFRNNEGLCIEHPVQFKYNLLLKISSLYEG